MTTADRRLLRHLATAVTVKLLALLILWGLFFHAHHARDTIEDSAVTRSSHILGIAPRQGEPL
jgi:hypothetical protein